MGRKLAGHFAVTPSALDERLGNHLVRVDVDHAKRTNSDGSVAYDWWGAGWDTRTEGYWHAEAPMRDRIDLASYPWPDPAAPDLLNRAELTIGSRGADELIAPNFGMCLFERAWSLRGFDAFLMDMMDDPAWVEELLDRITEVQVALARRFIGLGVSCGYFGDDYGAQRSMLFSPRLWRALMKPRLRRMLGVFRDAGLPVILHSDGDIRAILPDLIDIGLTVLNPVQPEVLDPDWLYREYGAHLSFYGGISTQGILPNGTPDQVRDATRACLHSLAPEGTGLLAGPSHRMQSDIPVENVVAMLSVLQGESHGE